MQIHLDGYTVVDNADDDPPTFEQMLVNDGISPDQAVVIGLSVGAADPFHHPPRRSGPAVETLANRSGIAGQVGRLHRRQEDMFMWTDTEVAPWTVIKSNDRNAPA